MKTVDLIIIVLLLFTSCSQPQLRLDIRKEYEKLAEIEDKEIVINKIRLLESVPMDFERLAKVEIQTIENVNKLRQQELLEIEKLDSLIKVRINQQQCRLTNADSEYQEKYLKEIESDSMKLKNNHENRLNLKIVIMEDEVKILEILELSKSDSGRTSKNLIIKHMVDISIDGEKIVGTLRYIMFNNQNYLNRNLFLEN